VLRVVSLNLNGIRSAASKGWAEWVSRSGVDCMGVQELKAQAPELAGRFEHVAGLTGHFHCAEKKGYSGVGLYAREAPTEIIQGFGSPEFDAEGRYLEARFDRPGRQLSIISCYFPSGSSSEERQQAKFRFLAVFFPHLQRLLAEREFILLGDVNIAHREIDLKNWKSNQKNSGFLPEERAWMTCTGNCGRTTAARPTPGGATAARPGPRTSAGASTTTWPHRRWPNSRDRSRSTRTSGSRIMRR
jgi:exodeoxyribonuclease-3